MAKEKLHPGFKITKCGLIISPEYLGMGASPDGRFDCECHGIGVLEVKCSWKYRDSLKLSEVAESNSDFFLSFNPDSKVFSLKNNHPYYYQIQQQMIVTGSLFGVLLVYIECDIAIVYIPIDEITCSEIKSKISSYMYKVMLPQLICENFVKSEWERVNICSGVSLEVVIQSESCVVDSEVQRSAETSHSNYLLCCQNLSKDREETVVCANIDCIIGTFHKSCIIPPRKRFGPNWNCRTCACDAKKVTKNKENTTQIKKLKRNGDVIKKRGLSLKN